MLFEEDLAAALKRKSEWVDSIHQSIYSFNTSPADTTSSTQFDLDCLIAQRLQTEFDNELQQQETYAHQIYQSDQQLAADLEHDLAEARSLASQWEAQDEYTQQDIKYWQEKWQHEDQQVAAQADFAKEVLRAEQEREESIRRDMAAATAVQMQWEAEALELERQVRRAAEEAERREEEERRRLAAEMAERERRAQIERARVAREEAERRAKEERRRKMAECVSCMEEGERKEMCVLSCGHGYCGGCVTGLSSSISCPYSQACTKQADEWKYRSNQINNQISDAIQMLRYHRPHQSRQPLPPRPPSSNLHCSPP
jgi:DNA repair exonuclease SbcCD ATPase subunit